MTTDTTFSGHKDSVVDRDDRLASAVQAARSAVHAAQPPSHPSQQQQQQPSSQLSETHAPLPEAIELEVEEPDASPIPSETTLRRETFIPLTSFALMDRLTRSDIWPTGDAQSARRFFRYLRHWRQQQYNSEAMRLDHAYEPFNPDSDLLMTRQYTDQELATLKARVVEGMQHLLAQANYTRIDRSEVELILTADSHYGLDFHVDLEAFEILEIYYRGASTKKDQRRSIRKFFRKEEFDVPIFQRLFILFKLKPEEQRIDDYLRTRKISRKQAERAIRARGKHLPQGVSRDRIYMKLFKNLPRADVEMIFPNTRVKFRLFDKIKLGVTSGGAVGMGLFGTLTKILATGAAALNPIALATALFAIGGVLFRQIMGFFNTRQRYMVVMAQNLYFHALADNRGVMITLADRAAEEDVKEEMLLYSVLAKETVRHEELKAVDQAVEEYLSSAFGVHVDFDLDDALQRLMADGIVTENLNGTLRALSPVAAAEHIDRKWDTFLDDLSDTYVLEGTEFDGFAGGALHGPEARSQPVHIDT
ncbi:MAG: TMEM143 family protein [Hyphomicrobiaceae bacterium]